MIAHYTLIFLILATVSFAYLKYAQRKNIIDNPNERSSHTTPTIRGGGIIFFAAVLIFFIGQLKIEYSYFLIGFIILSTIGFIDDNKELSAKLRFPFQLLSAGLILYDAGLFTSNLPLIIQIFGFIASVSFINAFNFMDGINGITGFYSIAILLPFLYINQQYNLFSNELFIILIISIVVFGFYNFRKQALFFAGDIGSMAMASVLLFIISKYMIELKSPIIVLTVIIYGLDSALTIIYRFFKKEKVTEAHRWHLYQKLVDISKCSHLQVGALYALLQIIISTIVFTLFLNYDISTQLIILFISIIIGLLLYIIFQFYYRKKISYIN